MALGSDIGGVVAGLLNGGQSLPTIDLQPILDAIQNNKNANTSLISGNSAALAPLYAAYQQALGAAGNTLNATTGNIGQTLLNSTQNLYGPNSPAVQATLAAMKQQDYSTLPGNINALKASLAGSGGLDRGAAARAIQTAVLNPATQYSQQAANTTGQQLQAQQSNVQQALNKIASMDDQTAQSLFGMSKDEATQILTSGRQDLQQQLTQLINTNNAAATATEGAYGIQAQNAYQNALTRDQQQAALTNGLVNLGVDAGTAAYTGGMFGGAGAGAGSTPALTSGVQLGLPLANQTTMPQQLSLGY